MEFELLTGSSFTDQLLALPLQHARQVNKKVNEILRSDPRPDGVTKKKLEKYVGNVCRLRSGDYRIVYTYGDGWVKLLAVRNRRDVYNGEYFGETPQVDLGKVIDEPAPVDTTEKPIRYRKGTTASVERYLPTKIDTELLTRLRIPERFYAALVACETEDELLNAEAPEGVIERVMNVVLSPDLTRVLSEPNFIVQDEDDLVRFVQGDLLGFLLKLDEAQERIVDWGMKGTGPILVKGSPGTGKSTVALYRVQVMLRALRAAGIRRPRILFTTYTKALVNSSEQLLTRLLGPDAEYVEVRTADSVVNGIFRYLGIYQTMCDTRGLIALLRETIEQLDLQQQGSDGRRYIRGLPNISYEYLLEEIRTVIEAREISSLGQYLTAARVGRRVPLTAFQRETVWKIYQAFGSLLDRRGAGMWERTRRLAASIIRSGGGPQKYDGVVIDEVQDLDPSILRLLILLCKTPNRLFITADANQSIYGSTFRWTDVSDFLQFRGRTELLKTNHRSTQQIDQAARSYLRNGVLEETDENINYTATGPLPVVRYAGSIGEEIRLLGRFFTQSLQLFQFGRGACAVLVPTNRTGQAITQRLQGVGLNAVWMTGEDLDLENPCIKVMNLKSAKGLEFPIVAVAGFVENPTFGILPNANPSEQEERLLRERRSIFVGMTRAMRSLLLLGAVDAATPLLQGFDPSLWNERRITDDSA